MTAYFLDTEFINAGPRYSIELLSVGIACEDGRSYYAQNVRPDLTHAGLFVQQHVLPRFDHLSCPGVQSAEPCGLACPWRTRQDIAADLREFLPEEPDIWTDFGGFDYVVISQTMGSFEDWPSKWPMFFKDFQWWWNYVGSPDIPERLLQDDHHALRDARNLMARHTWLADMLYDEARV